jgi:hypothetical protein
MTNKKHWNYVYCEMYIGISTIQKYNYSKTIPTQQDLTNNSYKQLVV